MTKNTVKILNYISLGVNLFILIHPLFLEPRKEIKKVIYISMPIQSSFVIRSIPEERRGFLLTSSIVTIRASARVSGGMLAIPTIQGESKIYPEWM